MDIPISNDHLLWLLLLVLTLVIGWTLAFYMLYRSWKERAVLTMYRKSAQYKLAQLMNELYTVKKRAQEILREKRQIQHDYLELRAELDLMDQQRADLARMQMATLNLLQDMQSSTEAREAVPRQSKPSHREGSSS